MWGFQHHGMWLFVWLIKYKSWMLQNGFGSYGKIDRIGDKTFLGTMMLSNDDL